MEHHLFHHGLLFFPLDRDTQTDPAHVPGIDVSVALSSNFQDDVETVLTRHCCCPGNTFGLLSSSYLHPLEPSVPTLAGVSDAQNDSAILKRI